MKHKARNCFLSYHHKSDQDYVGELRALVKRVRVSDYSLKEDISHLSEDSIYRVVREKMRRCSVTIILIGDHTGHRKWIDWEMWASLRSHVNPKDVRKSFKPNGLLGIYLPLSHHSTPPRLQDNIDSGYAVTMAWNELSHSLARNVHEAYRRRTLLSKQINNHRPLFERDQFNILGMRL